MRLSKKITGKQLIDFKRKSSKSKATFINNFKIPEKKASSGGGDYWISCLSAIRIFFKDYNIDIIDRKIEVLHDKISSHDNKRIKDQFKRNLDILENFKEYDYDHTIK